MTAVECKGDDETSFVSAGKYKTRTGEMKTATLDTPFNIASISEIIQHLGLLILFDKGKLFLDENVAEIFPTLSKVTKAKVIRTGEFVKDIPLHPEKYGTVEGPYTMEVCFHTYLNVWQEAGKAALPNVCKNETYYLEESVLPTVRDMMSFSTGTLGWWRPIFDPFVFAAMGDSSKYWPMSLSHEIIKQQLSSRTSVFQTDVHQRMNQNLGFDDKDTLYLSHVPGRTWSYNEMATITALFYEMGAKDVGFQKYFEDLVFKDIGMTSTYVSSGSLSEAEINKINDEIPLRAILNPSVPKDGWSWDDTTATDPSWLMYPDAAAPANLEGHIKSTTRDLVKLASTLANGGWSKYTNKRILSPGVATDAQQRKSLGRHPVEVIADDYFKPRPESGYFSEFVVDTTSLGYTAERQKWENPLFLPNRRDIGAVNKHLAMAGEYESGWYGIWGIFVSWDTKSRCLGMGATSMSYSGFTQSALRDQVFSIWYDSVTAPTDWY